METVPAPNGQRRIGAWHRAFLPLPKGSDHPYGLACNGWRCLVFVNKIPKARLSFLPQSAGAEPEVTGVTTGRAVSRWVAAIARAWDRSEPHGTYEPALLIVPDALASGLLLLPKESGGQAYVWSLIRQANPCSAGLQPLKDYMAACAAASPVTEARKHA